MLKINKQQSLINQGSGITARGMSVSRFGIDRELLPYGTSMTNLHRWLKLQGFGPFLSVVAPATIKAAQGAFVKLGDEAAWPKALSNRMATH